MVAVSSSAESAAGNHGWLSNDLSPMRSAASLAAINKWLHEVAEN